MSKSKVLVTGAGPVGFLGAALSLIAWLVRRAIPPEQGGGGVTVVELKD